MKPPARLFVWAGLFAILSPSAVMAQDACQLSEQAVCEKLQSPMKQWCVKNVIAAKAACRKANRNVRSGSHADQCREVCRARFFAVDLGLRLHADVIETIKMSSDKHNEWRASALEYWRQQGSKSKAVSKLCTRGELNQARQACEKHCASVAVRRDLKELQALAAGKDFLALQPPGFACVPNPIASLLSRNDGDVLDQLYPPDHPRRSSNASQ